MYKFEHENQGASTYLVYRVEAQDALDTMSLGMLTNNRIRGIAPTLFTQMDTVRCIKFNVTSKIPVSRFLDGTVNKSRLLGVFSGIADALLSAEDYMLDTASLIMDLDYMFVDVSSCETMLICLPLQERRTDATEPGQLLKRIMFTTQFDQSENCDYVVRIINFLNSAPVFSYSAFKELLQQLKSPQKGGAKTEGRQAQMQDKAPSPPPMKTAPPQKPPMQTAPAQKPPVEAPPMQKLPVEVPPIQKVPTQQPPTIEQKPPEKEISLFYLLQHYNAENAAAYKVQKEAKKAAGAKKTDGKKTDIKKKKKHTGGSFAIPGELPPEVQQKSPVSAPSVSTPPTEAPEVQQKPPEVKLPVKQPAAVRQNFGETVVLNAANGTPGETTVLTQGDSRQRRPYLYRFKNNEKILLNKSVYHIGKEKSYVDYFIGDNTAVSRSHADFLAKDGAYFVVDQNSTNHTYVNGVMIAGGVEHRLESGDRICLANEEFEFRLT